eukprot:SAG22_NODE_468_length_10147_cov_77.238654_10_plen_128_part_00
MVKNSLGYVFGGYAQQSWSTNLCRDSMDSADGPGSCWLDEGTDENFIFQLTPNIGTYSINTTAVGSMVTDQFAPSPSPSHRSWSQKASAPRSTTPAWPRASHGSRTRWSSSLWDSRPSKLQWQMLAA